MGDHSASDSRTRQSRWARRLRPLARPGHAHYAQQSRLEHESFGAFRARNIPSRSLKSIIRYAVVAFVCAFGSVVLLKNEMFYNFVDVLFSHHHELLSSFHTL